MFEYSKLFLLRKWWEVFNGLDDLMAALYAFPDPPKDGIHSDHGYLDTWEIPRGPH